MINIAISRIRSVDITHIPSETITGPIFKYANIARIRTADGSDFDILFDERGEPLIDAGLVKRVGDHYGIKFEPIAFDNRPAYAEVRKKAENTAGKQTPITLARGSNPYYS